MSECPYPPKFTQFLASNGIELSDVEAGKLPRFIRINPSCADPNAAIEALEKETGSTCTSVDWMPHTMRFYSLDSSARISGCPAYESGDVYGIDVASAVAVIALGVESKDHVLDLCCAPGGKMCLISDIQGNSDDVVGTVTGVDISLARISTCKSVLRKYKMRRFRLFEADGTSFDVHAPSRVGKWTRPASISDEPADSAANTSKSDSDTPAIPSKRKAENEGVVENPAKKPIQTKVKPFHATKVIIGDLQIKSAALLYDKVLVDAECTHDGSIAHLKKSKMDILETLQRGLISNGFRLLKPGGILVYSTCSFLKRQNEDIINWFQAANAGCAVLEAVPGSDKFPVAKALAGESPHMLRFTPTASNTKWGQTVKGGNLGKGGAVDKRDKKKRDRTRKERGDCDKKAKAMDNERKGKGKRRPTRENYKAKLFEALEKKKNLYRKDLPRLVLDKATVSRLKYILDNYRQAKTRFMGVDLDGEDDDADSVDLENIDVENMDQDELAKLL
ncbi:hypothetical protein HDU77_009517, partial [Chytriomyces hyalinus]